MEPSTIRDYPVTRKIVAVPEKTTARPAVKPSKIRVLVVDDSAIVRKVLSEILSAQPDLDVVGTAPDPYIARDKIVALRPDVLTLDIEMPRMDGLTFLDKLMQHYPLPVIVVSSLTQSSTSAAMEALSRGAVDVLAKPGGPYSVGDLREDLPRRVRAAAWAGARLRSRRDEEITSAPVAKPLQAASPEQTESNIRPCLASQIIAIGASTGGTQAIEAILARLPASMPPMVITQHIPAGFSAAFAQRLNRICALEVREAAGGETLKPGVAFIAPGDHHLIIEGERPRKLAPAAGLGSQGLLSTPLCGCHVRKRQRSRSQSLLGHPAHGHGVRRKPGDAQNEDSRRPHHRGKRKHMHRLRHAQGSHQVGGRRSRPCPEQDCTLAG